MTVLRDPTNYAPLPLNADGTPANTQRPEPPAGKAGTAVVALVEYEAFLVDLWNASAANHRAAVEAYQHAERLEREGVAELKPKSVSVSVGDALYDLRPSRLQMAHGHLHDCERAVRDAGTALVFLRGRL